MDAWKLLMFLTSTRNTISIPHCEELHFQSQNVIHWSQYVWYILEWVRVLNQGQQVVSLCPL